VVPVIAARIAAAGRFGSVNGQAPALFRRRGARPHTDA
jgi:hypothetical protein